MVPAWFGTRWPGNPFAIGVKVLREESGSNRAEVSKGAVAVRFATRELAEHFLRIANGLEMRYAQCEALEQSTRDELRANRPAPPVIWCRTIMKLTMSRSHRATDPRY